MFPIRFEEYVFRYSKIYEVDPYLVFSIIKAESSFDTQATSRKSARGLMQLTEATAAWGAKRLQLDNYHAERLYEPEINIQIGCWLLHQLMKQFDDLDLVIAAYNGGSGNVKLWLANKAYSSTGKKLERIPYRETANYLKKVNNFYLIYKRLYEDFDS